jgi:hypothetical protein
MCCSSSSLVQVSPKLRNDDGTHDVQDLNPKPRFGKVNVSVHMLYMCFVLIFIEVRKILWIAHSLADILHPFDGNIFAMTYFSALSGWRA